MARNAKPAGAVQAFRGGLPKLGVWAQHLGGDCCAPSAAVDIDRLPPTVQWENANIHTSPIGGRNPTWRFKELKQEDQRAIIDAINAGGVGTIIEAQLIPTFSYVMAVAATVFAEETGLTFRLVTRNGTYATSANTPMVSEVDGGNGCGGVVRTLTDDDDDDNWTFGALEGDSRRYYIDSHLRDFALEADVLGIEVVSVPAGGVVVGKFDLAIDLTYESYVRSAAA